MGKITFVLSDEIIDEIRTRAKYKGDLSKIAEKAFREHFNKGEGKS